jgi:hypothetical protein
VCLTFKCTLLLLYGSVYLSICLYVNCLYVNLPIYQLSICLSIDRPFSLSTVNPPICLLASLSPTVRTCVLICILLEGGSWAGGCEEDPISLSALGGPETLHNSHGNFHFFQQRAQKNQYIRSLCIHKTNNLKGLFSLNR